MARQRVPTPAATIVDIPPAMDYAAHEKMWERFISIGKWTAGVIFLLMIFLYFVVKP